MLKTRHAILSVLLCASPVFVVAQTIIGNEANLANPKPWSGIINVQPGDGETVIKNPPVFSWFYNTNWLVGGELNPGQLEHWSDRTNSFQLQITTAADTSFASPVVDVTTFNNFYNFLPVLDTNSTRNFRWRVIYKRGGTSFWTNSYTFTIANGAEQWDRSMMADSNYLATNAVHPMYCFRSGEERAIYKYWETNNANDWFFLTNVAAVATNKAYWPAGTNWIQNASRNPNQAIAQADMGTRANEMMSVLVQWTFSKTNEWTNSAMTTLLMSNLNIYVKWYLVNNVHGWDFGSSDAYFLKWLMATYDWTYNYTASASTSTVEGQLRTNVLHAITKTYRHYNYSANFWMAWPLQQAIMTDYDPAPNHFIPSTWGLNGTYDGYVFNCEQYLCNFTNNPVNGQTVTLDGAVKRWTNNTPVDNTWLSIGATAGGSATNFIDFITTNYPYPASGYFRGSATLFYIEMTTNILALDTYATVVSNDFHYTNIFSVAASSITKFPHSHNFYNDMNVMPGIAAIQQEGGHAAFAFDWMFNYMISKGTPFTDGAGHHIGPYGYAAGQLPSLFEAAMTMDVAYPQAQIWKGEFYQKFADWYTRLTPPEMRKLHGPYGDGGPVTSYNNIGQWGDPHRGKALAGFARNGLSMQHYNVSSNKYVYPDSGTIDLTFIPLMYHYRNTLPAPTTNTTSAVFIEDGYAMASSLSPSLPNAYTNGVGFSAHARPRGLTIMHDIPSDGSVDMWVDGTQVTDDGGTGLLEYDNVAESSGTHYVNGLGPWAGGYTQLPGNYYGYGRTPGAAIHARIAAFTNSTTNFVYVCLDLTPIWTNANAPIELRTNVTKVKRHIFFPKSKYWIIYDEFGTRVPSSFAIRQLIPWVTRYDATDTPLGTELFIPHTLSGGLGEHMFVSNSLVMNSTGFTFTAGNVATGSPNPVHTPPRIPVHVFFFTDPDLFVGSGTNQIYSLFSQTNTIGTANTNSTLNPLRDGGRTWNMFLPDRAASIMATSPVLSTNYVFGRAIVPQRAGKGAPSGIRIDDHTVRVIYDGDDITTTFDPDFAGSLDGDDFQILADGTSNPEGGQEDPPPTPGGSVLKGAVLNGGRVQ